MSHAVCSCAPKCAQQCHCRDYVVVKPLYLPRSQSTSYCYHKPCPHTAPSSIKDRGSTVSHDQDKFQVNLDVSHFKAEELSVKITNDNNLLIVEGRHEEQEDEQGYISRHFIRKYALPAWSDPNRIESKITPDGVLTVTAPKIDHTQTSRIIPIVRIENTKIIDCTSKSDENNNNCPCTE